jgi:hypothetical protein
MIGRIVVGLTTCEGRVTNPKALKSLHQQNPHIHSNRSDTKKKKKQEEMGNLPTCLDATSFLTHMLEDIPNTPVARIDFQSLMTLSFVLWPWRVYSPILIPDLKPI